MMVPSDARAGPPLSPLQIDSPTVKLLDGVLRVGPTSRIVTFARCCRAAGKDEVVVTPQPTDVILSPIEGPRARTLSGVMSEIGRSSVMNAMS